MSSTPDPDDFYNVAVRHPGLKLNIPPQVFCILWCPDFEFRGSAALHGPQGLLHHDQL